MSRSLFSRLAHTYGTPPPPAERRAALADQRSRFLASYPLQFEGVHDLISVTGRVKVAIVGGGLAGLSAAWSLSSQGFQVEVFEARDRPGGRVFSVNGPGGALIERGGELVGRNHPNWIEYAKRFDLGLSLLTDEGTYSQLNLDMPLVLNGETIDDHRQEQIFHEMQRLLVALNTDAVTVDPDQPWTSPRAEEWDHRSVASWISEQKCSDQAKAALRFQLENNQSVAVEQQSYLALLAPVSAGCRQLEHPEREPSRYWTDSEIYRCASGNQSLAEALMRETPAAGGRVHRGTRIDSVFVDSTTVKIVTAQGEEHSADFLILAIPPSCWHTIDIHPKLEAASSQMQMGLAVKCLCTVKERFWLRHSKAPSASTDRLGMIWEGTDNQNLAPGSGAELSVFAGGSFAKQLIDVHGSKEFLVTRMAEIYPEFEKQIVSVEFVDWPKQPFTQAGYSCPGVGQVTTVARYYGEAKGRLIFAGEHTSPAYFGYMEGALQSGLRAAKVVAKESGV